ncbi:MULTISPECIES: WD40 repeat domain-containing protein [unclassified Schlesneria]|uniref:WD40 repeat domain-containing protein n=1 Tax=unclassified Schlesneria TaxID=2762017 RepID=UPI002F1FF4F5
MSADPMQTHIAKTLAHTSPLISCRIDPTGRFVFAGAEDSKVVRWELATGNKVEFIGHESWVRSLAFSANGETLITGGHDGKLIWWSAAADAPVPLRTVQGHDGWIRDFAVSPDGQFLASCGNDLKVKLWSLADGGLVRELLGHERHVYGVAFHPDGKQLVSGDLTAKFVHWEVETGKQVRTFEIASLSKYDPGFMAYYGGPFCLEFHADGKRLFAGGITNVSNAFAGVGNPIIVQIDWEQGKDAVTHLSKGGVQGTAWGLTCKPEGFLIGATGGQGGGHLFFWKYDQKDEFHTLNLGNVARDLSLHPDGLQIATAHYDKNLRISLMAPKT